MNDGRFNDPARDSLFVRLNQRLNRCTLCHAKVTNNTESRDHHLSGCAGWAAHCNGQRSRSAA